MKKPTCLILTGIGVLIFVLGLVFVVPWFVNIYQDFGEMTDKHVEYIHALREFANIQLTEEQQQLLSHLLEQVNEMSDTENADGLEHILSSEPYLKYLKMHDGGEYADYPAYLAAMPTDQHRSVVKARLGHYLGTNLAAEEQEIWVNFYYTMRQWSKAGKSQLNNMNEFSDLLNDNLVKPLSELQSGNGGVFTNSVKMGAVSAFMLEENEVFHSVWQQRLQTHERQEGYLRCAIATPAEFALMRSFFEDAATFQNWITEPLHKEEVDEQEEQ
ncbi:MAG: hypothetical protein OXD54_10580 [Candidatus Poribacteria bacterium]|nr:hypothetical protein [Candidatus Poribacteria bacterium]